MTNLINLKKNLPFDLYIGRENAALGLPASKWGNPFKLKREGDRPFVLWQYLNHILASPELVASLSELDILIELRQAQLADHLYLKDGGYWLEVEALPEDSLIKSLANTSFATPAS